MKIITLQDPCLLGPLKGLSWESVSSLHGGQGEGEGGAGWGRKQRREREGKSAGCSTTLPPNRGREGGKLFNPEDNLIQLSQHQPSKSAIYGAFLLANSLHKREKKSNTCRDGERCRPGRMSLPSNHVWGCFGTLLCSLSRGTVEPHGANYSHYLTNSPLTKQVGPELAGVKQKGLTEAPGRLEVQTQTTEVPSFIRGQMQGLAQPICKVHLGGVGCRPASCRVKRWRWVEEHVRVGTRMPSLGRMIMGWALSPEVLGRS